MSNWTHVAGIIRVDHLRLDKDDELDFDEIFGKECHYSDDYSVWDDWGKNPNIYMPGGSEGTLRKSIWKNPDENCMAAYTVSVFGDLRDHYSADEIINWFKSICSDLGMWVRNAVIVVNNEYFGQKSWVFNDDIERRANG